MIIAQFLLSTIITINPDYHAAAHLFEMPGPGMSRERGGEEVGEMYTWIKKDDNENDNKVGEIYTWIVIMRMVIKIIIMMSMIMIMSKLTTVRRSVRFTHGSSS